MKEQTIIQRQHKIVVDQLWDLMQTLHKTEALKDAVKFGSDDYRRLNASCEQLCDCIEATYALALQLELMF